MDSRRSSITNLFTRRGSTTSAATDTPKPASQNPQQAPNTPHVGAGLNSPAGAADAMLDAHKRQLHAADSNPFARAPQDDAPASSSPTSATAAAGMSRSPSSASIRPSQTGLTGFLGGMKRSVSNLGSPKHVQDLAEASPPQSPDKATPSTPGSRTLQTPKSPGRRNTFNGLKSLLTNRGRSKSPLPEGKERNPEDAGAGARPMTRRASQHSGSGNWMAPSPLTPDERNLIAFLKRPEFVAADLTTTGAQAGPQMATKKKLDAVLESPLFEAFCKKEYNQDMLDFCRTARVFLRKPDGQAVAELIPDFRAHQTGSAMAGLCALIDQVNLDGEGDANKRFVFQSLQALSVAEIDQQLEKYGPVKEALQKFTEKAEGFLVKDVLKRFLADLYREEAQVSTTTSASSSSQA